MVQYAYMRYQNMLMGIVEMCLVCKTGLRALVGFTWRLVDNYCRSHDLTLTLYKTHLGEAGRRRGTGYSASCCFFPSFSMTKEKRKGGGMLNLADAAGCNDRTRYQTDRSSREASLPTHDWTAKGTHLPLLTALNALRPPLVCGRRTS